MTSIRSFAEFNSRLREFISRCQDDEEQFTQLAVALFRLQFERVEPYRRFCQARRVHKITHWTEIPCVPAAAFKEFELSSLPNAARSIAFRSSGTTGQRPSWHFHNAESLAIYEASLLPWFKAHLLPDAAKFWFVILTPAHAACSSGRESAHSSSAKFEPTHVHPPQGCLPSADVLRRTGHGGRVGCYGPNPVPGRDAREEPGDSSHAPHSSLAYMLETVWKEFGSHDSIFVGTTEADGSWSLDLPATLTALEFASTTKRPVALLGTAFSFVHLLDRLVVEDLSVILPAGSRVMETGGYKGRSRALPKSELHALITDRFGIPASHIVSEYGMSELSSQAYDRVVGSGVVPNHFSKIPAIQSTDAHPVRPFNLSTLQPLNSSPAHHHFAFPPWARARVVSPETRQELHEGETGLIQVYDLANVRSVMAIQTEDLAVRRGGGFELIGRIASAEPRGCSLMSFSETSGIAGALD